MRKPSRRCLARAWTLIGVGVLFALATAGPAHAQAEAEATADNDQVILHGKLFVPEGETVGAAVIFDGPARVEGTVTESLVVFNGRVEIIGTVRGDVVVFNGNVVVHDGAQIGGNLITRSTPEIDEGADVAGEQRSIATGTDWADLGFAGRFVWWLAYTISTVVLGLILLVAAPRLDAAITWASRDRTGASIGIGVATFILLPIVAVLLLATIVGIPLGLFLLLGLALLYTVGYVVGAHAIGRFLVREPRSRFLAFLAGWAIVRVLGLIPIVGGLVWILVTIFGLGALVTVVRRATPMDTVEVRTPPPPAPVPAV
jgi:hypothetical protein